MIEYLNAHPLLLFLVGWPFTLALGIKISPHYYRLMERLRAVSSSRIWVLSFALLAVVSSSALVYSVNARHTATVGNTYLTRCLSQLLKESTEVSASRADAVAERDDSLRLVVELRVTHALPPGDPAVRAAVQRFELASDQLARVRRVKPLPSFEDYCRNRVASR